MGGGAGKGSSSEPPEHPLDPPLAFLDLFMTWNFLPGLHIYIIVSKMHSNEAFLFFL